MQESYGEGLASRTGPESCAQHRKVRGEALTGARAGRVIEPRKHDPVLGRALRGADAVEESGRPHGTSRYRETRDDPARSESQRMLGNLSRENRESPWSPAGSRPTGRIGKSQDARR
jgi:RNA-directed DNA polymerase